MIKSWKTGPSRRFAETGKSKFSVLDEEKALSRLRLLDAVSSLEEIPPLKSVGLYKLEGDRSGQWAVTISGPWRLVFEFHDGDAYDVEIVDYH